MISLETLGLARNVTRPNQISATVSLLRKNTFEYLHIMPRFQNTHRNFSVVPSDSQNTPRTHGPREVRDSRALKVYPKNKGIFWQVN